MVIEKEKEKEKEKERERERERERTYTVFTSFIVPKLVKVETSEHL